MGATNKEQAQIDVIINGQKATATIADMEKAIKTLNLQIKNLQPGTEAFIKKSEELNKVKGRLSDVKDEVNNAKGAVSKMLGEMDKLGPAGGIIGGLKGAWAAFVGTAGTVVRACFTITGAMIAIPIFALIAGITALIAYFKSTDEGADLLEQKFAGLKAIFDVVIGVVARLGKGLFDALSNPKQLLSDLVDFIKGQVINRLTAMWMILQGIATMDFKKIGDGFIQSATGIENAREKAAKLGDEMGRIAEEANRARLEAEKLTAAKQDLEDAELALSEVNSRRKGEIDVLIAKNKEQTLSVAQRMESLKQAGQLESQMAKESLEIAEAKLKIAKLETDQNLKNQGILRENYNSEEAFKKARAAAGDLYKAEVEAQIKVNEILNERDSVLQNVANRESKFIKEIAAERKRKLDEEKKLNEEVRKNILKLEIDNLSDSLNDRKKRLQMEYQEELKQLKGNEEQKNEQAALLRQKFFSDIDKLETQYEADEKKKREDAEKKRLEDEKKFREQQNKDAIAGADLELALAEGNADRELSAQLNKLEIQKNIELQNQELTNNEKALINKRYEDDKAKLEEQYRQAKLQKEAQTAEAVGSFLMQGAQAVAGLEDQLAQNKISKINDEEKRKETSLDKQLKKGKITEEEYNKRKQQLEDESAKKTALIKNKQAKIDKASNIAQAVMTTILAVLKSLTGAPWPANLIMAAATGAIGAVNVAKIAATPLPTYSLGGFIKRIWGGVKRMFNVGGIMPGPSHGARYGESGIAMINRQTGQEIGEMEGKEIILTKGVANNPKLRAEASRINVAGGGRSFEAGVNLSASSASNTPGAASTSSDISILSQKLDEQIQATKELRNIVFRGFVVLQDINDANDTLQDIKNDAKL